MAGGIEKCHAEGHCRHGLNAERVFRIWLLFAVSYRIIRPVNWDLHGRNHIMKSTAKWIIRAYESRDFDALCQVHDSARKNELALAGLSEAFLPLATAADREGLFDYQIYVAEGNSQVLGFVAFTEDELAWLYVDVKYPRCGIGSRLIRYALGRMQEDVSVEVLAGNQPALAAYSKFGFRIYETVHGKMPGNEAFPVTVHVLKRGAAK